MKTELLENIGIILITPGMIFLCALAFDLALKIGDRILPPWK